MRYARSDGVAIAYRVIEGDGPPVVFVPGFASNVADFESFPAFEAWGPIVEATRWVMFDKRGTGLSDRAVGVADLESSIVFYSGLFGAEPTVTKADYAKWMLDDPRINFAISQKCGAAKGIEHLGVQVEDEAELAEVGELIGGHRLVTLIGAGGVGKTRLAVRLAAQLVVLAGQLHGRFHRLAAAAREHDLLRRAAEKIRDTGPGVLHHLAGGSPGPVATGRIAMPRFQGMAHDLGDLGGDRGAGVEIQIDVAHGRVAFPVGSFSCPACAQ